MLVVPTSWDLLRDLLGHIWGYYFGWGGKITHHSLVKEPKDFK